LPTAAGESSSTQGRHNRYDPQSRTVTVHNEALNEQETAYLRDVTVVFATIEITDEARTFVESVATVLQNFV
jgi:hypothetical protein